jgi:hypothetical protein
MKDNTSHAEINAAKVPVDGNMGGVIFAASTVIIFLLGIPLVRYLFPAAIVAGGAIAFILHFIRRETPGAPSILATGKRQKASLRST